ncbi:MAG: UvrB/UvrC motif-containing protein [bacterium]
MADAEICQKCKTAIANVTVTHYEGGKEKHLQLCEECAKRHHELKQLGTAPEFFKKFMENMFGTDSGKGESLQCSKCNLTLAAFEKSGFLGCEECYTVFQDELSELLRRVHGSHKHIGSRPRPERVIGNSPDLEALKEELLEAIEQENYERAAEYRDMIRDIEREIQRKDQSKSQDK